MGRAVAVPLVAALLLAAAASCAAHPAGAAEGGRRQLAGVAGSRRRLAQTSTVLDLAPTTALSGGKSPAIIAANLGHRHPSSNWKIWMRRLGVNSARAFLSSTWGSSLQSFAGTSSSWGKSLNGTYVDSEASFTTAVATLRTAAARDPTKTSLFANPVKWDKFEANFNTTNNATKGDEQEGNHGATLAALAELHPNTPPLVVIGLGLGSIRNGTVLDTSKADYWRSRWETYKHVYAFSKYLYARGIRRIEPYNEPDLDDDFALANGTLRADLWVEQLSLRSRAIQDLYADMNTATGGSLKPDIHAGAFAKTTYAAGKLGQPTVQGLHRTFARAPNPDASWFSANTYSYHSYGQTGKAILGNFNEVLTNSTADRNAAGAFDMPFAVTEHNAKTSGDYSSIADNLDTPAEAAKLAAQALYYSTAGRNLSGIYVFKFSVTLSSNNGVAKNGIHWGDNTGLPYDIADSALGAEGYRLIAEHLAGAKDLLTINSAAAASMTDARAVAVRDGAHYWLYVSNTGSANLTLALNFTGLGVSSAGVPVVVERLAANSWGEVSELANTTAGGRLNLTAFTNNLLRIRVPASAYNQSTVAASAAIHVRAGANSAVNYGTGTNNQTMCVGTTTGSTQANTYAAVMKFSVPNAASVSSAVLRLNVTLISATTTSPMPLLLLGITNNSWTAAGVTWSSLAGSTGPLKPTPPAGAASTWAINAVNRNFINYAHPGIAVAGHVTLPAFSATTRAPGTVEMVDVTAFVKASGGTASFVLLRPFRNNKETTTSTSGVVNADTLNGGAYVCFHGSGSATTSSRPSLVLQYAA